MNEWMNEDHKGSASVGALGSAGEKLEPACAQAKLGQIGTAWYPTPNDPDRPQMFSPTVSLNTFDIVYAQGRVIGEVRGN